MSLAQAEQIARALLYEGYSLYPYRGSALKNRFRWTFGTLYPPAFAAGAGERCALHAECLVQGPSPNLHIELRFLQPVLRSDVDDGGWQEAIERCHRLAQCSVAQLEASPVERTFAIEPEPSDAQRGYRPRGLSVRVRVMAERVAPDAMRIAIGVANCTTPAAPERPEPARAEASLSALASAHVLLQCQGGEFVSALEPPLTLLGAQHDCRCEGVWPVLVGTRPQRDSLLFSPIILGDYPAVAPESPGDFFDATEIDAMLALRLQTLSELEKRELRRSDPRARALLERAEALGPGGMQALHGTWRTPPAGVACSAWAAGDRVRLHPRPGRDVLDLALAGEIATVVGIERDVGGRVYCSVTVDRDPGRDLGAQGCIGHRFFFEPDELERMA